MDAVFLLLIAGLAGLSLGLICVCNSLMERRQAVIYALAGVGAVALSVYLTVSLLKPEWFS